MCKISIIVPVYNIEESFLKECLDSLIRQSLREIEILVIDDGSTDASGTICDSYALKDRRITVIHQKNQGVSCARNNGIELATGEYILFLDGDDFLATDTCEKLYTQICSIKAEILLYGHVCVNEVIEAVHCLGKNINFSPDEITILQQVILNPQGELLKIAPAGTVGKMYLTSFIRKNQLRYIPGLKRMQDNLFCLYAYQNARKVYYYDYPGYYYRINRNSVCNKYNPDIFQIMENAMAEFKRFVDTYAQSLRPFYYCKVITILITEYLYRYFRNRDNPQSLKIRKQVFKALLQSEQYADAIKKVDISLLSPRLKISTFLLRNEQINLLWFLLDIEMYVHKILGISEKI